MSHQELEIVGNIGNDPQMRFTPNGAQTTSLSIAVSRKWTDRDGNKQENTVWFNVSCWEKDAETASTYLHKGDEVMVKGVLSEPRIWTAQDGTVRASLDVRCTRLILLRNRARDEEGGGGEYTRPANAQTAPAQKTAAPAKPTATDEDIPF